MDSLAPFSTYLKREACLPEDDDACVAELDGLADATSLDIDYDAISHALRSLPCRPSRTTPCASPRCGRAAGPKSASWPRTCRRRSSRSRSASRACSRCWARTRSPRRRCSRFPRGTTHDRLGRAFRADLPGPTRPAPHAAHVAVDSAAARPARRPVVLRTHAYLTLRAVFPDKYQLSDDLFLASKNLSALRHLSQPVDLEAPDYVMGRGVRHAAGARRRPPTTTAGRGRPRCRCTCATSRRPTAGRDRSIPYPAVFWACHAEEGTKFPTNPFDRVHLGYDALFGPRTVFFHVDPGPGRRRLAALPQIAVTIPVLDAAKATWVNAGTAAVILLGFGWVLWKLFAAYTKAGGKSTPSQLAEDKKKK